MMHRRLSSDLRCAQAIVVCSSMRQRRFKKPLAMLPCPVTKLLACHSWRSHSVSAIDGASCLSSVAWYTLKCYRALTGCQSACSRGSSSWLLL